MKLPTNKFSFTCLVLVLAVLLAFGPRSLCAQKSDHAPKSISNDEVLWNEILAANRALLKIDPYSGETETILESRKTLLNRVRVYLRAYPGGRRCDAVVQLEFKALFEIATLSGGDYADLRKQVAEYLEHPPSEAALHEAAFWKIRCDRIAQPPTSQPTSAPYPGDDPALRQAFVEYISSYPQSRYVPGMASELCLAAAERGDFAEYRKILNGLERNFPEHLVTKSLAARLRRQDAVGQPFSVILNTTGGDRIDTAESKGRPIFIVVWAGFSASARDCVKKIELLRNQHPEGLVVGVNLDESEPKMDAACRQLQIIWPQNNDGLGWANDFVRQWGVTQIPWVFVIDRAGKLVGSAGADGWSVLAGSVLEN